MANAVGGRPEATPAATSNSRQDAETLRRQRSGRIKALLILLICAVPVVASYFTYYVIRPDGRTNYGTLMMPLRTVGPLLGTHPDGTAADLAQLRGKWVMLTGTAAAVAGAAGIDTAAPAAAPAVCDEACDRRLYAMRQLRLVTGKDRDRVERVWVIPPAASPAPELLQAHEGLFVLRAPAQALRNAGFEGEAGHAPGQHIWILDPLGNIVLRYPADADPNLMKKDLLKLLKASRIG